MTLSVVRTCPALDGNYPQIPAWDAAAASYTANIYDMATGSILNSGAYTSGTELTVISTAAGAAAVLDMGHANVVADWDALTAEGANILVEMIPDSGSTTLCHVIANDAEHVALLYPDDAVYADADSANIGTAFPLGSIKYPCRLLSNACTILTARGFSILDCKGSWDSNHATSTLSTYGDANGGCRAAGVGSALSAAKATIRTRATAAWYPHVSGEAIDLVDCTAVSLVVPAGFSFANFTNGTYFEGNCKFLNCRLQASTFTGNGAGRYGGPNFYDCDIEGTITMSSFQSPGCYGCTVVRCTAASNQTFSFASFNGFTASFTDCTGPFTFANLPASKTLSVVGHKGSPTLTIASSMSASATLTFTGAIDSITDQRASGTYTLAKLAHRSDLTGSITTLADGAVTAAKIGTGAITSAKFAAGAIASGTIGAGAITSTEAPNLDVAVSTRAAPGAAMTISGTITTLDALDTAQDTQHATTQASIAALNDLSSAQAQSAATAALTAYDPATGTEVAALASTLAGTLDANVVSVAGSAVADVTDFQADVSALATSAALSSVASTVSGLPDSAGVQSAAAAALTAYDPATGTEVAAVASDVTTLLSRLGANDLPIVKGMLLGNYVLDGGAGSAAVSYDANGHAASQRIRVFADASATAAATLGAANDADGEIARVVITSSPVSGQAYPASVVGALTEP